MKRSLRKLRPGATRWLERGLYAYRTKTGEIHYGISFTAHGSRVREVIGPSKTLAKSVLARRRVELAEDRFEFRTRKKPPTMEEFCETYLKYAQQNKRSWKRDEGVMKKVRAFFPAKRIDKLTAWDVERYKSKFTETISKASVNRELAILKRMLSLAIAWGVIESNPAAKVKLFKEEERPFRVLTDDEVHRLIRVAPDHLRAILVVALNTGMRRGELFGLRWDNVSFEENVITVEQSKSGRIRHIPMNRAVHGELHRLKGTGTGHVFTWQGEPLRRVTRSFSTAFARAGIKKCRFHDLRHTFATNLVQSGVDLVTVMQLLGHADISTTMRYAHPSPETKRNAVDTLLVQKKSGRSVTDEERVTDRRNTEVVEKYGAPETIRTSDTRFRKPVLYPPELRGHLVVTTLVIQTSYRIVTGRQTRIVTEL